jgi:hypothetical protein
MNMKPSNIIFTSFLCICALIILAGALDIRFFGKPRKLTFAEDPMYENRKTIPIPACHYLKVENSNPIKVIASDTSKLVCAFLKDSIIPDIHYTISGDTLLIKDVPDVRRKGRIRLYVANSLKGIYCNNATISLSGFKSAIMDAALNESRLNDFGEAQFDTLIIKANNYSTIKFTQSRFTFVSLNLNKSEAEFGDAAIHVKGTLEQGSNLWCKEFNIIELKKDFTSKFRSQH